MAGGRPGGHVRSTATTAALETAWGRIPGFQIGMKRMDSLFATVTALVVSVAITPLMIRLAPSLRMLDQPNARKVHLAPIPRVGGWGITLGALISILLWLPVDPLTVAYCVGAMILLLGGALDDSWDLPPKIKLLLQIMAAAPVALHAGLLIDTLPLFVGLDLNLPMALAVPLTLFSLVACINATNTSDGLDGLAAGVTLLSFAGILYLAYLLENTSLLLITAAATGGLAGFLRFNTHPAAIFMGDSGSQFLGFTVGFLGLALLQPKDGGLQALSLLLLVGLPLADLVVVASRRVLRGVSPFRADKTHIHHRFLDLGITHNQSVILIYIIQASFVFFAVALRGSSDWKILLVFGLHLAVIYGFLNLAEGLLKARLGASRKSRAKDASSFKPLLVWAPRLVLEMLVPLVMILCAALATQVPTDFGVLAAVLLLPLAYRLLRPTTTHNLLSRVPVFVLTAAAIYLYTDSRPFISTVSRATEIGGLVAVALFTAMALRFSPMRRQEEFHVTGMDYLLMIVALLTFLALQNAPLFFNPYFLIYLPIMLYGCEIIMVERRERRDWLLLATLVTALVLALRGLLS